MVEVIPGINETDIGVFSEKVALVAPHVEWVQVDIMDGSFVPATTLVDIEAMGKVIADHPKLSFEAHLMVEHPETYVRKLAVAGFKRIIAHVEANDSRIFLEEAQYESVEVGLAIDAPSEFELIEPFLDTIDVVLVMTVEAGASGNIFLPETVEKIRLIHENLPDLPIEVDGGINDRTAVVVRDAGATRLVSTNYIFRDPGSVDRAVRSLLKE